MKLRVEVNGEPFLLDPSAMGQASAEEVMPGVFSVLLNEKSVQVRVAPHTEGFEVWSGSHRYVISLVDARDAASDSKKAAAEGPVEVRAQMPGKIIKILMQPGASVTAGQGLMVVEAMKMQNEVKAPKSGILTRVQVAEGATVSAGELLVVVE